MGSTTGLKAGAARGARWPWALATTVAGAAAGAAVAWALRRVEGEDQPGAQEPDEVQAVVDRPGDAARPPA